MIAYTESTEGILIEHLQGFFVGWKQAPTPEKHLQLLGKSDYVILAKDGEKVVIPMKKNKFAISVTATTGNYPVRNGNLNLNNCTAKDLDDLPGVGAATAKKIIDLRNQLGRFSSLEQLKPLKLKKNTLEILKTQATI
jgi:DNA uptake protein ComE-like DNA-binding protein